MFARTSLLALLLASGLAYGGVVQALEIESSTSYILAATPFDGETRIVMESLPCTWASLKGRVGPSYGAERFDFSCKAGVWGTVTLLLDAGDTTPAGLTRIRLAYRNTKGYVPVQASDAPVAEHFLQALLNRYVPAADARAVRQAFWNAKEYKVETNGTTSLVWVEKAPQWQQSWLEIQLPKRDLYPYSAVGIKPDQSLPPLPIGQNINVEEPNRNKFKPVYIGPAFTRQGHAGLLEEEPTSLDLEATPQPTSIHMAEPVIQLLPPKASEVTPTVAQPQSSISVEEELAQQKAEAEAQARDMARQMAREKAGISAKPRQRLADLPDEAIEVSPSVITIMPTAIKLYDPKPVAPDAFPQDIPTARRVGAKPLRPEVIAVGQTAAPVAAPAPARTLQKTVVTPVAPQPDTLARGAAPQTLFQKLGQTLGVLSGAPVSLSAPLPTKVNPASLNTAPAPESLAQPTPPPVISATLVPTPEMLNNGRTPAPTNFSAYNKAEQLTRDVEQKAAQATTGLMQAASPTVPAWGKPQPSLPAVPTPQVQQQAPTPTDAGLSKPAPVAQQPVAQPAQPPVPLPQPAQPDPRFTPNRALPQLQFIPKAEPLDTRSDVIRFEDEGSGL